MTTLQPISCQQEFPGQLVGDYGWSQGAVVPVQGEDRLVICGGRYITGCLVWTPTGWQDLDTPYFNKRYNVGFKYYIIMMGRGHPSYADN